MINPPVSKNKQKAWFGKKDSSYNGRTSLFLDFLSVMPTMMLFCT